MPEERQPYVKPVVQQLQDMSDQHVTLAAGCKTAGSNTGPVVAGCHNQRGTGQCAAIAS